MLDTSLISRAVRCFNRRRGYRTLCRYGQRFKNAPTYPKDQWCFLLPADRREPYFSSGTLVALQSIRATHPEIPVAVIFSDLSIAQQSDLAGCELLQVDDSLFDASHRPDMGTTTFLRFYAHKLPYSRIVYVDADAVVVDKLTDLFTSPSPLMARAVDLPLAKEFRNPHQAVKKLPIREGYPVFNAGLMAFSTPFWREHNSLEMCQSLATDFGWDFFLNADQSMWIAIAYLTGGFGALPPEYNFMTWSDMEPAKGRTTTSSTGHLTALGTSGQARILHWVGAVKPWHFDDHNFTQEKRKSLFEDCYLQFADSLR